MKLVYGLSMLVCPDNEMIMACHIGFVIWDRVTIRGNFIVELV
jgi:hypothetical protein